MTSPFLHLHVCILFGFKKLLLLFNLVFIIVILLESLCVPCSCRGPDEGFVRRHSHIVQLPS